MRDTDYDALDYFRDPDVTQDPYPYYEFLRGQCPVARESHHDVVMITGYEEAISVYHDPATFSSCISATGPFPGFPVPLEGDDISEIIEQYRYELPFSDQLPSYDPPKHTDQRGLLMRLITPKRLKENEAFMWGLADQTIDDFLARGECEFISEYAAPFTLMVIADLLGVPEADHAEFRKKLQHGRRREPIAGNTGGAMEHSPLAYLYEQFTTYIEDRRREPRDDVMTGMASATFPDGTLAPVEDVMRIAANLFSAGQETTARLMTTSLKLIGERPELQQLLRDERDKIPAFVEEVLRTESPIKGDFRLARVPTTIGGVDIPAGTTVMVLNGAANRDPREFECPAEFRLDRVNGRQHLGFGHGIHTCAGAPLARAEARVTIERFLERMHDIRVSESFHGPADDRRYEYSPTFMLRGVQELCLEFTPGQ